MTSPTAPRATPAHVPARGSVFAPRRDNLPGEKVVKSFLSYLKSEMDVAVTVASAPVVSLLELTNAIPLDVAITGVLIALASLALTVLRDRWHRQELYGLMTTVAGRMISGDWSEIAPVLKDVNRKLTGAGETLQNDEIPGQLAEAHRVTDCWCFKGGAGSYLRDVTVPACIRYAARDRRPLRLEVELIDPTKPEVCEWYARHLSPMSPTSDEHDQPWTLQRVRLEVYATILALYAFRERHHDFLDVTLGLSSSASRVTYDLSSTRLLITSDDARDTALMFVKGSAWYGHWRMELRQSLEQARPVRLDNARTITLGRAPGVTRVRQLFNALGLPLDGRFSDHHVEDMIRKTGLFHA